MPGIAGIISRKSHRENKNNLTLMVDCMLHEPSYASGTYVNEQLGLYIGWVCHKGSFSDCMPVFNENNDLIMFFDGENFTDREVIDEIREKGHEFDSYNATYLIHLYEEKGDHFFEDLNGWFSGIIIDIKNDKAILFNDRYGMQRIYYHEGDGVIYFSSEAKSLLRVRPELRQIDYKSLGEYFAFGSVLENQTLFNDVFLLPGGSKWTFYKGGNCKKAKYFDSGDLENQTILEKEVFYAKLNNTFKKILPRYFNPKDQIGISLTGGLDTRIIMSYIDTNFKMPSYTYGGMYKECFDVKIARKVAGKCNQAHQVLKLDKEFLVDFASLAEKTIYITDGCLNICGSHEVYLSRMARRIAPIRMTGNYGSEVLRSANYIRASIPNIQLFHPDFNKYIQHAEKAFRNAGCGNSLSYSVFKLMPWVLYGLLRAAQSQLTLRTPYMDNDIIELMYRAPREVRESNEVSLRLVADGNHDLQSIMTDRGVGGNSNFFLSQAVRLYREFLFKTEYRFNEGMPDWLAKINKKSYPFNMEKIFLGNHKIENYCKWFRNELSSYISDILLDDRTANRPYIDKGVLRKLVNEHINGDRNNTIYINKVITVELIHRLLIEGL